jgi:N-terminal domain on NACHT_NTPase and P-loop NTPases
MSGVGEAGLVVGLISGIIAIIDATRKVYDAATDQQGLPAAFREVAQRLPLIRSILVKANARAEHGQVDDEAAKSILETCKRTVEELDGIFQKVVPQEGGSRLERYYKAARTLGKGGKVEALMKRILDDLHLLSVQCGIETGDYVETLKEAMEAISALEPSVPDHIFDETSYTNINSGSGTQNNFNASGGENYNNVGSGPQISGSNHTFNWGKQ